MNTKISLCGFNCGICPAFKPNIRSEEDRLKVDESEKEYDSLEIEESSNIIEFGEISCPNCGYLDEGIYCSNCGSRLRKYD